MRLRGVLAGVGMTAMLLAGAGSASADPAQSKKSQTLVVECDSGIGTVEVVTNGNGEWTPGHVRMNNQVLIPYEFHFSGSFTPPGGPTEFFSEDSVKKAPRNGRLATCTFSGEGEDESGSFEFSGIVKVSYTPAR